MFTEPTVFILGAGASWHYGYPTGAQLIEEILTETSLIIGQDDRHCEEAKPTKQSTTSDGLLRSARNDIDQSPSLLLKKSVEDDNELKNILGENWLENIRKLNSQLKAVNPLSIDSFLRDTDQEIQSIGKFIIAYIFLKKQTLSHKKMDEADKKFSTEDDWLRYIIEKIRAVPPENLANNNNIKFITFNYDISLETRILKALKCLPIFSNYYKSFFETPNRFHHVYGQLYELQTILKEEHSKTDFEKLSFKEQIQEAKTVSEKIKIIGERKIEEAQEKVSAILSGAKKIYILGYGFDDTNNQILGLLDFIRKEERDNIKIYLTNMSGSKTHNKIITYLQLHGEPTPEKNTGHSYTSKNNFRFTININYSNNNVYHSLEKNFDL